MLAQVDQRKRKLGTVALPQGEASANVWLSGLPSDLIPVDEVDVIFWPSREAASRTIDYYDIWGGHLKFEDVPVIRAEPSRGVFTR